MISTIPYHIIKEVVLSGCKFIYVSYDHKACVEEMRKNGKFVTYLNPTYFGGGRIENGSFQYIPPEVKKNHIIWRSGKLRVMNFDNNGLIKRIYIGNKRAKCFFLSEFGITFKPIIFKSDDKYDLINQCLAIEDKI
jgi:hypothetical protein